MADYLFGFQWCNELVASICNKNLSRKIRCGFFGGQSAKHLRVFISLVFIVYICGHAFVSPVSAFADSSSGISQNNLLMSNHQSELKPVADCFYSTGDGTYFAYFGYKNGNDLELTIDVGEENYFSPGPLDQGQITSFLKGHHHFVFRVQFEGENYPTWHLNGRSETITRKTPHCEPSPTEVIPSPTDVTPSPTEVTPSPTEVTPSPTDVTPSPTEVTPSPTDGTPSPTEVTPSPTEVTPSPTDVTLMPPIRVVPTPVTEITSTPINDTLAPIPEATPSHLASSTVTTPQPTTIPTPLMKPENNSNSRRFLSYVEFILIMFLLIGLAPLILLANIGWEHYHSEKIKTSSNLECTLEGVLLDLKKRLRHEQTTLESLEKKAWEYEPDSVPQRLTIEIRHARSCVNAMMMQRAELEKYLRKDDLC